MRILYVSIFFNSLAAAESIYPNCVVNIAGDFNRLDVTRLKKHFQLKEIVETPTRKDAILDLVLTYSTITTINHRSFHPLVYLITILYLSRLWLENQALLPTNSFSNKIYDPAEKRRWEDIYPLWIGP